MPLSLGLKGRTCASLAAALLLAGMSVCLPIDASASPRVRPCVWPDTGTDLQRYFGVSTSLVIPFGGCDTVLAGSTWSTPVVFYVARTWEHVPAGYVPTGATPRDELVERLTKVRLIVDEGTPGAFTVERSREQVDVVTARWQEVYPDDPDWLLVDIGTHLTLRPLPVGQHTVRGEFELDGAACDGTSAEFDQSCIPPGVFAYPSTRTFQVVAKG